MPHRRLHQAFPLLKTGRITRSRTSLAKLIEKYYADLADLARQNVLLEMGSYSVNLADTMGIVNTPQEIVEFMCGSVS